MRHLHATPEELIPVYSLLLEKRWFQIVKLTKEAMVKSIRALEPYLLMDSILRSEKKIYQKKINKINSVIFILRGVPQARVQWKCELKNEWMVVKKKKFNFYYLYIENYWIIFLKKVFK